MAKLKKIRSPNLLQLRVLAGFQPRRSPNEYAGKRTPHGTSQKRMSRPCVRASCRGFAQTFYHDVRYGFLYLEAAISNIKCLGEPPLAERIAETSVFASRLPCGVRLFAHPCGDRLTVILNFQYQTANTGHAAQSFKRRGTLKIGRIELSGRPAGSPVAPAQSACSMEFQRY